MLFLSFYLIFLGFTKYHFRKARCQNPPGEKRLQEAFGDTFREMILSDKADLLHVEKVHLALRGTGREKKKRKNKNIHTKVTAVAVYSQKKKKVEAKNEQRQIFSAIFSEKQIYRCLFLPY